LAKHKLWDVFFFVQNNIKLGLFKLYEVHEPKRSG